MPGSEFAKPEAHRTHSVGLDALDRFFIHFRIKHMPHAIALSLEIAAVNAIQSGDVRLSPYNIHPQVF